MTADRSPGCGSDARRPAPNGICRAADEVLHTEREILDSRGSDARSPGAGPLLAQHGAGFRFPFCRLDFAEASSRGQTPQGEAIAGTVPSNNSFVTPVPCVRGDLARQQPPCSRKRARAPLHQRHPVAAALKLHVSQRKQAESFCPRGVLAKSNESRARSDGIATKRVRFPGRKA